jgi:hypothetical protein
MLLSPKKKTIADLLTEILSERVKGCTTPPRELANFTMDKLKLHGYVIQDKGELNILLSEINKLEEVIHNMNERDHDS